MNYSNATRQVEELQAQQQKWWAHAIQINTPTLYTRLQQATSTSHSASSKKVLNVKKPLSFSINCNILHPNTLSSLVLEFIFPCNYPEETVCVVKATSTATPPQPFEQWTSAINAYLAQSFVGCECIDVVMEWISEHNTTCLSSGTGDTTQDTVECFVLRYNHLLQGAEHKKEKNMVDCAKKSGLKGGILWGTPGIVVIVPPSNEEDAKEYANSCRTLGKRPDGVEAVRFPKVGVLHLTGMDHKKLLDLTVPMLRQIAGDDETLLKHVLGVV